MQVVKLEPPAGSPSRAIGPFASESKNPEESLFFWRYNLNKKSVALDFENAAAQRLLTVSPRRLMSYCFQVNSRRFNITWISGAKRLSVIHG